MTAGDGFHERLMGEVLAAIGAAVTVRTVRAEREAAVAGRTGEHVVDMYWEFTDGDIVYRTVLEGRRWDRAATTREVFAFLSLLRDIPGQTAGVWFTQPVYDKDVRHLAAEAGVVLYELRLPAAAAPVPVAADVRVEVDAEWARAEKERRGLAGQAVQVRGSPRLLFLYDEEGNCLDSVDGVVTDALRRGGGPGRVEHRFAAPVFLRTENEEFPLVKLAGVSFTAELADPGALDGAAMVDDILERVLRFFSPVPQG